jgi:hypothetical protein
MEIAGVVLGDPTGAVQGDCAFIFDDDAFYDFYSCQTINEGCYIELTGVNALYRSMRETAVCYNA